VTWLDERLVNRRARRYVVSIDNGGGQMIDELTSELLDLTVTVQGRTAGAFAMLAVCCCSSCCCGGRGED
jgi:hypothetical protein